MVGLVEAVKRVLEERAPLGRRVAIVSVVDRSQPCSFRYEENTCFSLERRCLVYWRTLKMDTYVGRVMVTLRGNGRRVQLARGCQILGPARPAPKILSYRIAINFLASVVITFFLCLQSFCEPRLLPSRTSTFLPSVLQQAEFEYLHGLR